LPCPSSQGVFIFVFGCLADKKVSLPSNLLPGCPSEGWDMADITRALPLLQVQEALRKHFCHTQSPNSTISLVSAGCKASAFPESTARSREKITGF
jgi:hypothetical protein